MKLIGVTALLTLAIITECFGASDRSRSRSPSRSAPVTASVKREVDFDCPEEFGYYPHPTDCTLYYVCVFGGALLESCTGGLMYSHELQTCDWPRNVGCDGTSVVGGEELERLSEREPRPQPPPRRAPPPPPRAQPNPVVTSRGQPKFNRQEYEKQQQLYAEVDDLPPIEELENDRQQRVYRGQPATIGQVQKDRDGYSSQPINSGRNYNSNIIPASLPQSSKIGSFSFGSQVDERRTATVTPAPQSYSEDKSDTVTDSQNDRLDIETNEINTDDVIEKHSRSKRETVGKDLGEIETNTTKPEEISKRIDSGEEMEYIEFSTDDTDDGNTQDDAERGKRQVRYYLKNGYKAPGKNWALVKPVKIVEYQQPNYNPNVNNRYQQSYNNLNNNYYYEASPPQSSLNNNDYSTSNPFLQYQADNLAPQGHFKPSLQDNSGQQTAHNPLNAATQLITRSPPISSLSENSDNFFTSLTGGFINNAPKATNVQYYDQYSSTTSRPQNLISFPDSSQLASTIVTGKPVLKPSPRTQEQYRKPKSNRNNYHAQVTQNPTRNPNKNLKQVRNQPTRGNDYEEETSSREEDSSEEDEEEDDYRYPEFKFPSNKYKEIVNPFANPDFDFDAYLSKLSYSPYSTGNSNNDRPHSAPIRNPTVRPTAQSSTDSHLGYRSPSPSPADIYPISASIINPTVNPTFKSTTTLHSGNRLPNPNPTLAYNTLSTPKPFTVSSRPGTTAVPVVSSIRPSLAPLQQVQQYAPAIQKPDPTSQILQHQLQLQKQQQQQNLQQRYKQNQQQQENQNQQQQYQNQQQYLQQQQNHQQQQQQYQPLNENLFRLPQSTAGVPLEAVKPKLKPPNFKDDRQLPISYSFIRPIESTLAPTPDSKPNIQQVFSVTGKPYYLISGTAAPGVVVSTPKQQYIVKPDKIISLSPHTGKPYLISSVKPQDVYPAIKLPTTKPLSTLANEQLAALQQIWNNPTTSSTPLKSAFKSSTSSNVPKKENLFSQVLKSTQSPVKIYNNFAGISSSAKPLALVTTSKPPPKRRPIPKPSPEMNDYYYDDDEEYYDEPVVKPKYMPSTEIKPKRPLMAQNDEEYDSYEDDDDEDEPEQVVHVKPSQPTRLPVGFSTRRPESATKNHNDVSIVTKLPLKDFSKNINGKIPVPVLVDYASPTPTAFIRPELSNYALAHHNPQNKTHIRKPVTENGPNTLKPPKYLNQTTLRPYTVRHRLAKPTTVKESQDEDKKTRGHVRHQNLVAQILSTTPRDSHNQETRFTKTNHDDKTNSLEPTESVVPLSYSASPRPKMLYNGSQSYSPDQYDPFYAVYDEDGELYKDTDYVQQYNTASLRPAVQQTYRGTPPPARRPVETYTPRPSADDYDDELIQPQISNQNQYQAPIRHSTRGEGNELGYEHNPSSVKTTLYEATTIRTTPRTTTSTSTTTTQRPTTAPYTEAMTPRHTSRSSTVESPTPESSSTMPSDESTSSIPPTPSTPVINVSSLAKPFEKTDNSHRLGETIATTGKPLTARRNAQVTNNNKLSVEVGQPKSNRNNKKVVSLTSGFSIRRNSNNTNNPYTLTVLTRPIDDYVKPRRANNRESNNRRSQSDRYYYDSNSSEAPAESKSYEKSSESSIRRKSYTPLVIEEDDIPVHIRPASRTRTVKPRIKTTTTTPPSTTTTTTTSTTENYDIQASKRPTPFSVHKQAIVDSTENSINTEALIEAGLQNARSTDSDEESNINDNYRSYNSYTESAPLISPYKTLDNIRNSYKNNDTFYDIPTSSSSTTRYTTTTSKPKRIRNTKKQKISRTKPSYFSYRIDDDIVPDQTTEVFNDKVKNVIKTFLTKLITTSIPEVPTEVFTSITTKPTTPIQRIEDEIVNIGYQKKPYTFVDEKPLRSKVKRLQIITEPSINLAVTPKVETVNFVKKDIEEKDFSSTTTTMATMSSSPYIYASLPTSPLSVKSSTNDFKNVPVTERYQSKFSSLIKSKPDAETSQKFQSILNDVPSTQQSNKLIELIKSNAEDDKVATENVTLEPNTVENEIASTTSTTKSTTTLKIKQTTLTTKSISFPTRPTRVNPAIKLAASNPGSGRRSYQSSSKCSSDNSLQANPKCNEIKVQRPTSTRGRGTAHFANSGGSDSAQPAPAPNRGTPPTRSRPTLKPSTAIVSKTTEFVDIYAHPPSRPAPVYPQPTPDKTAAKCRKDVCQLPDCYCGGKDIPGEMPVEQVPQIVLLTFDDSVNDLNKGLYADLFEKGRVNPNGCPISATFYVSHEWTDYSQVQNLYSAGHEMASHTISHSFGEQFSQKKWNREVAGQREILAAYGGVKLEDVRGMRAPFLSVGGNKMFKMLYDSNFTYDSSLPVYENRPPSWPYTLDYKLFHDCMIPPCPTKSYPGVWEVPMVMWQDLNGGRCSMGDACANPPEPENVYKMILKNFDRHYTTNRAPFGLFYHAAWFTQPHHKEGFIMFLDFINQMQDVWIVTNWQALQWVRDPTPISRMNNFQPFQCNYQDRPKKCNNPKVCNLWHKSGVRYMRTCQPCPEIYPWTGKSGISSSRIDNDKGE